MQRPISPRAQKAAAVDALAQHPFRCAWWARAGLVQTALQAGARRESAAPRLERWDTPDGDSVRMHFWPAQPKQPTVLLLHGLEGSRHSRYVGEMEFLLRPLGWQLVVLEFRSCGGEANRLPRSYHSGETGDLAFVVERLLRAEPDRALFAVGFSLGGNALLKWLGEVGERAPPGLLAAAAVSPPFDLEVAARQSDRRYRGLIAHHFLRTLVPKAIAKAQQFPGRLDVDAVRRCRTFAAFDDLVTAPLHGFANAQHYWRASSCAQFLPAIRRPTLLLAAGDDPLAPEAVWPRAAVAASEFLVPQFSPRGGHVGFAEGGPPWRPRRWAEAQVVRFLSLHAGWRNGAL